ncbi:MAG: acyltransferase, partial [Muribaculaceae bacterium]|nr:acyltransferase [Muribaculaceae bacterium]
AVPGSAFEIRGNGEMFPVNGPQWSLFFEYIGNVLYALVMRRMPDKVLFAVTALFGVLLGGGALLDISGYYHLGVGWTLADHNFVGGMLRMLFSFSTGLCMARVFRPVKVRGAFWICALAVVVLLSLPYAGTADMPWLNALYDVACIVLVFPVLVWIGASGTTTDRRSSGICKFLGDISYPVYAVHYPLMYLFYAWVWSEGLSFADSWPVALAVAAASILIAWLSLRFYDEPVRRRLTRRFLSGRKEAARAVA